MSFKLDGGFGDHLKVYAAFALRFLSSPSIKNSSPRFNWTFTDNIIPNDTLAQRNDTRSSLRKILRSLEACDSVNSDMITLSLDNHSYYMPYQCLYANRKLILDRLIDVDTIPRKLEVSKNDIVISFRLGMGENEVVPYAFSDQGNQLPFDYYIKSLDMITRMNDISRTIFICSDNYQHDKIKMLKSKYPNAVSLEGFNTLEQFRIILDSSYFISSNSSFSIMASIFMNDDSTICYPSSGKHLELHDIPINEPRIIRVPEYE